MQISGKLQRIQFWWNLKKFPAEKIFFRNIFVKDRNGNDFRRKGKEIQFVIQNGKTAQDKVFFRVNRKNTAKVKQMYFIKKATFFDKNPFGS